jgi:hypothetical protein
VIILAPDPSSVPLEGASGVCIRHKTYASPPPSAAGWRHMTWEEAVKEPRVVERAERLAVVGLNRIISPGNRTTVGPILLRPAGRPVVSIDRTLFVCEPWRAWWHFGCVGAVYREYSYSYLAESHWKAASEGRHKDPFSLDAILDAGRGVVRSLAPEVLPTMRVDRVELPAAIHEDYQREKARAFEEEHTAKAIIFRLAAFADTHCATRRIPTLARLFAGKDEPITQTDLRVDDFLVAKLRGLVDLTNAIARGFHHAG